MKWEYPGYQELTVRREWNGENLSEFKKCLSMLPGIWGTPQQSTHRTEWSPFSLY